MKKPSFRFAHKNLWACAGVLAALAPVSTAAPAEEKPAAARAASTAAAQPMNADYAARVREYTTEPYFMTELVDHLPASDKVPSPEKVLGYVVGTPGKLTYTKDLYR